jgi:DNA-binding CsgD family transcriptional regulator
MTLLADAQDSATVRDRVPLQAPRAAQPSTAIQPPYLWEQLISPAVDAVADAAPRGVVVGNAGSGKSATLRHLHALLTERSRDALYVHPGATDVAGIPGSRVLIVDDLHRVVGEQLVQLRTRAADPEAALIVALRPSAWNESIADIVQRLEGHHPSVVLGHVSRADVLSFLASRDLMLSDACLTDILEMTSGVSWLVSEALRLHHDRDCRGDATHHELRTALEERIGHRMQMVRPALREEIERICIASPCLPSTTPDAADHALDGYAEALLLRSGQPVPLVRATVQATMPTARLIALNGLDVLDGPSVGEALVRHADLLLPTHPERSAELYQGAVQSGMDAVSLAARGAEAAWSAGDLDAASALVDGADASSTSPRPVNPRDRDHLADTSAAIWSARGMMQQACAVYRASPPSNQISEARARIAELAVGVDRAGGAAADGTAPRASGHADDSADAPSTLGVAMSLLRRGLDESVVEDGAEAALADLVRASEMYTASRTTAAVPELPAVLAAIVALNLGSLTTARSVIEDAIAGEQGGQWARPRLFLWAAWIAVALARPTEAREALVHARNARSPRDVLLAHAVQVAIARRYEDAAGLEAAWRHARPSLLRVDVDLYLLHPLGELISSASRAGDAERIRPAFERALGIVERLGNPALWSVHLRWAGIQNGIMLNSPDSLRPHARSLVEASATSRVALTMAKAGRVWTSVLGGTVDADAVEQAAHGLASVGLVWDAARLAGHGAARSEDRKVSARLLACARELHPIDGSRRAMAASGTDADSSTSTPPEEVLSERELEVARLVVEGKTYAEIGEAIFISPRTAEHHIAHIRRRLGATSRSEVIAKLRQLLGSAPGSGASARVRTGGADAPP